MPEFGHELHCPCGTGTVADGPSPESAAAAWGWGSPVECPSCRQARVWGLSRQILGEDAEATIELRATPARTRRAGDGIGTVTGLVLGIGFLLLIPVLTTTGVWVKAGSGWGVTLAVVWLGVGVCAWLMTRRETSGTRGVAV